MLAAEGDRSGQAAEHPQLGTAQASCAGAGPAPGGRVAPPPVPRWAGGLGAGKSAGTAESRKACLHLIYELRNRAILSPPHPLVTQTTRSTGWLWLI